MKILIVGCGSIGERHLKNLQTFFEGKITVTDTDENKLQNIKKKYNVATYINYTEALKTKPDGVIVCTPTNTHIDIATKALQSNSHVFIEKPLSNKLNGVDELVQLGKKKNKIIYIGFNLHFDSCLNQVKKWIDEGKIGDIVSAKVHFGYSFLKRKVGTDYRNDYAGKESMGGGVILDVIHEIEYLTWLLGDAEEVFCYADTLSQLEIDVEDITEILFKFKNNAIGSVHLDFMQLPYTRYCMLIGLNGTIEWNFAESTAKVYDTTKDEWQLFNGDKDWNSMYLKEIQHFIACIKKEDKPVIAVKKAKGILEIALAAKESSKIKKVIKL